jgi:hypothetical protein
MRKFFDASAISPGKEAYDLDFSHLDLDTLHGDNPIDGDTLEGVMGTFLLDSTIHA